VLRNPAGRPAEEETTMMRGIVLMESLAGGALPTPLHATVRRTYRHLLGGQLPVQVAELVVSRDRAVTVAMRLAEALSPKRFYAHLLDDQRMYVVFPNCVVLVHRDEPSSIAFAQETGQRFEIPLAQMRFAELFNTDHPDSPVGDRVGARS
jgi:hypothetical protein